MSSTNDEADAAVDAVLAGLPHDDDDGADSSGAATAPETGASNERDDIAGDLPPHADTDDDNPALSMVMREMGDATLVGDEDTSPCTEAEARALLTTLTDTLVTFENTLVTILRRKAWAALGYDSPAACVMGELGPTKDPDASGGVRFSRGHAYRMARLAMFLYGLAERVGDEAYSADVTERLLRGLPSGTDHVVMDRVENALASRGEDANSEDVVNEVVTTELQRARDEYKRTGEISPDPDDDRGASQNGSKRGSGNPEWEGLDEVEADDDTWTPDAQHVGDPRRKDLSVGGQDDDDEDTGPVRGSTSTGGGDAGGGERADEQPHEQAHVESGQYLSAYAHDEATAEAVSAAEALRGIIGCMRTLALLSDRLPDVLDYADSDELLDLIEQSQTIEELIAGIGEASTERL